MNATRFIVPALVVLALLVGFPALTQVLYNRHLRQIRRSLQGGKGQGVFTPERVAHLPAPAQRYFRHAIAPGAPLALQVHLTLSGSIKPRPTSPWLPLAGDEVLRAGEGFVWQARVRSRPGYFVASEHYASGQGGTRIALFGLLPVANAGRADASRSALGRLLIDSIWVPAAFLPGPGVTVEEIDNERFRVAVDAGGEATTLTFEVDANGRLREVSFLRYGNLTAGGQYTLIPFGITVDAERTFDGYTIPSRLRAGWWYGSEYYDESIRLTVESAHLQAEGVGEQRRADGSF